VGRQHHAHGLHRVFAGAGRVGAVGFKMGFGEPIKLFKGIPVLRSVLGVPHTILGTNNMDRASIRC